MDQSRMGDSFQHVKAWSDAGTCMFLMVCVIFRYAHFSSFPPFSGIGDIIGAKGTIKRTEKGELSVYVREWQMLTKSLLPLPDKWSGLKDADKRYRQRHLDMIVNPQVRKTFKSRAYITSQLRKLLDDKGFLEIETPILNNQVISF